MQSFPRETLNQLRQHLEEEKSRVNSRIDELSNQDPFNDKDRTNDNAASDAEASEQASHDRFAALVEQLKNQLSDIDNALLRIGNGNYGFCTNCSEMIDNHRLAILTTATLCLSCEQKK